MTINAAPRKIAPKINIALRREIGNKLIFKERNIESTILIIPTNIKIAPNICFLLNTIIIIPINNNIVLAAKLTPPLLDPKNLRGEYTIVYLNIFIIFWKQSTKKIKKIL